jgi:hypothetical protein
MGARNYEHLLDRPNVQIKLGETADVAAVEALSPDCRSPRRHRGGDPRGYARSRGACAARHGGRGLVRKSR